MELDFDKICTVDLSPNTVLPSHQHCPKTERRNAGGKPPRKDNLLCVKEDFREISFNRYRSTSCKSIPSRIGGLVGNSELRRSSVYQSSKEVRKSMTDNVREKQKIEIPRSSDISLSPRIFDSLCSSDEERPQKSSPKKPLTSGSNPAFPRKHCVEACSSGFIEISSDSEGRKKQSAENVARDLNKDINLKCSQVVAPQNDSNELPEGDMAITLQDSLSAKLELPHSPPQSEGDRSSKSNSKARLNPIKKMLDPFMKSKSLRNPLGYAKEAIEVKTAGIPNMRRNKTFQKSLFHDFSSTVQNFAFDPRSVKNDRHQSVAGCSPVHLHGSLKVENKDGVPYFAFSLKSPEDCFVAKTWKTESTCNWVYTFHSADARKRSSASSWALADSKREFSMVGQMQVSCYLSSEVKAGTSDEYMVTEFVLYDIEHARKSIATNEQLYRSLNFEKPSEISKLALIDEAPDMRDASIPIKHRSQAHSGLEKSNSKSSTSTPQSSAELHPDLEIAAIIIEIPVEKRESLKFRRADESSDKEHPNLLNLAMADRSETSLSCPRGPKVKVVVPTGHHGVPGADHRGPSSLLDRLRFGGGCDCGGWDMSCPLTVLNNPVDQYTEVCPLLETKEPLELLFQGAKENMPALTLAVVKEGEYTVDFHAKLSTLQAFAICVAILHAAETSSFSQQSSNVPMLPWKSLKVPIEDEIKFLIEAVTSEEKKNIARKVKEIPPSFALNPPFSPIARV